MLEVDAPLVDAWVVVFCTGAGVEVGMGAAGAGDGVGVGAAGAPDWNICGTAGLL